MIDFQHVKLPEEEEGVNKQEDLQIHDRSPCLLLEVKGIAGMPTESDTIQGTKYVMRRMKNWKRTDVSGVFLVNHQRNIPALDRDHENAFTPQQLADADEGKTTIIFAHSHNNWAHTYIDQQWYCGTSPDWKWWNMAHGEPVLLKVYNGKAAELVTAIEAIAAGKEIVVPCVAEGKAQPMKASLKLLDYKKPVKNIKGWIKDGRPTE